MEILGKHFNISSKKTDNTQYLYFIFSLQAESCVLLRPFLYKLTKSELHAVMTGGFATVAGSYIALLVEVGVSTALTYYIYRDYVSSAHLYELYETSLSLIGGEP